MFIIYQWSLDSPGRFFCWSHPSSLLQLPLSGASIWFLFICPAAQKDRLMCCGCDGQIHTDYRSPVEKGRHGCSLRREGKRAPTPAWTGFYCFSGYITSRMVLIYYAQVLCRWLPFTDNKGKNVPEYPFVALFSHTHIKRTRPPSPVLSSFCTHSKILGLLSTKMFFLYFPNVFYSNSAYKNANYFSQNFLTFNT